MRLLDLLNSPWAILESRLAEIERRVTATDPERLTSEASARLDSRRVAELRVQSGVAVLDIRGVLGKRQDADFFDTSMEQVGLDFAAAVRDPAIRAVILHVDSPGGTVDGTLELARMVREARGVKPIVSLADGFMTSAAYWIGSAADKVMVVGQTTTLGSIGVIGTHFDLSGLAEKFGIRITHITAGKFKAVGSPFKPLDSMGMEMLQGRVNDLYSIFLSDVARQRGASLERVRTDMADARLFLGQQAIDAGLADGFATLDSLIAQLSGTSSSRPLVAAKTEEPMNKENSKPEAAAPAAAPPAAPAAAAPAVETVISIETARSEAAKSERERLAAIDSHAAGLMNNPKIASAVAEMKADGKTTPAQAAERILALQKETGAQKLAALKADAPAAAPPVSEQSVDGESPAALVEAARKLGAVR